MRIAVLSHRFKRQVLSRVHLARIMLVILLLVVSFSSWYFLFRPISRVHLPSHSGRINFLVLGIAGGSHDGADLTDTIIFASLSPSQKRLDLVSLPRDLWVPTLKSKINAAYSFGVSKKGIPSGLLLASSSVSEIIGQPIDFTILVDFSTFTKAIDLVGGIDVQVEHSFTDKFYPIAGKENDNCGLPDVQAAAKAASITDDASAANAFPCRYEQLKFAAGQVHLDGPTALKFARSRHSEDLEEGTDFARSARQAKVIAAFKQRLFSKYVISHPQIYQDLYKLAASSVVSDIPNDYYPALGKLAAQSQGVKIASSSISQPGQVYNPPISEKYNSQWVLLPLDNNPQVIFDFVSSRLN